MRLGLRVGTGATPVQPRSQAKHVIPSKKERRSARATAARASTSQEAPTEEQRKGFLRLIAEAKASENQARMLRTAMRELERELSEWEGKAKKARSRAAELAPEMAREMAETDEHSLQEQAKHLLQSLKGVDMRKVVVSQHAIHHSDAVLVAAVAPHSRADGRPGAAIGLLLDPATLPVPAVNDLKIHWGCCTGPGRAWKPPPAGWSTLPDKSQDSGGGAWRTPTLLLDGGALGARIQIALDGPLQSGGLAFALVADASHRAKWLKGEGGRDFFLDLKTVAKAAGVVPPRDSNGSAHRGQNGSSARRGKDAKGSASLLDGLDSVEEVEELLHLPLQEVDEQSQPHLLKAEPSALTQPSRWNGAVAEDVINAVAAVEHKAERSLMHRYDLAHNALDECLGKLPSSPDLAAEARAASGVAAISLWLRFAAARHLRWNVNYNVKPREISAAQDRLTSLLGQASQHHPSLADLLRVGMLAVGRGGAGDVGQRVRDEILSIQSRNHAKGGMMEEWHQKLHNNTSPDDVVICQALLAYLNSGLDISQYWAALEQANITRERLASFDRPIVSEPCFSEDQVEGLKMDLERYLRTLKAVHSGDDLEMAAKVVLGYQERTMKGKVVEVPPVKALVGDDRLRKLLQAILLIQHQGWHLRMQPPSQREAAAALERINGLGDASGSVAVAGVANAQLQQPIASWGLGGSTLYYLELLLEGRHLINDALASGAVEERIRDCVYLDLAMETATRSTLEALLPHLRTAMAAGPASDATTLGWTWATQVLQLAVHGLCLSWRDNAEILSALKQLSRLQRQHASNAAATSTTSQWGNLLAIQLQAVVERLSRSLGAYAERCMSVLEPSSIALAGQLRVPRDAAKLMGEEVVRGTLAAPIAQMLAAMEQHLLEAAGRGCWTIISPAQGQCGGRLAVVRRLRDVTHKSFNEPCVLVVAEEVNGDEDVPLGTVALVTPSRLDVLCHSAVRARNSGVLLATCTDRAELESWCALDGRPVSVTITGAPPQVLCTADDAALGHGTPGGRAMAPGLVRFQPHPWCNRWTVSEDCEENLEGKGGAKSCNLLALKVLQNDSSVPITSRVPQGMTVPFGAFEAVLDSAGNEDVQQELQRLKHEVARAYPENRAVILQQIRNLVTSRLLPPPSLLPELISAIRQMSASSPVVAVSDIGLPQGGSEGAFLEWQSGLWCSVTRVWASKWNDTAYSASARVGAEHDDIRMAVLCQEVLKARYSFVAHSCDPTTGDAGTMLIEMAPGLGEALVSNHPGQPFSFSVNKPKLRAAFQAVWSAIDAVAPFPAGDADQQGTHLNGASAWGGAAPEAAGRSEQDTVQLRVALARRLYGLEHEFKSLQGGAIGSSRCAELEAMDCSTLREAFRDCFTVLTLPSKSSALMMQSQSDQHPTHGGGAGSSATLPDLICRSDSNAEDLPDYAGAGVFDSVMLRPPLEVRCEYAEEPLIWDEEFQLKLMTALACACLEVEQAMAPVPQDIEGAVVWDTAAQDGYVAVVQTRPQA